MKKSAAMIIFSLLLLSSTAGILAQNGGSPSPAASPVAVSETSAVSETPAAAEPSGGLPPPGLMPDSVLYFLDNLGKRVSLLFTFGSEKKAEKALKFAGEKLSEIKAMAEKNNPKAMEKAGQYYREFLDLAARKIKDIGGKGQSTEKLDTLFGETVVKQQEALPGILEKAPKAAQQALEKIIEASQKGFSEAIKAVSGTKKGELLQKAAEIKARIEEELKKLKEKPPE